MFISVLNNKILVLGGVDSSGSLSSTMHEYDPEKNRWKVFGQLPRPMKSKQTWPSCSKLMMSLVNNSLKFTSSDMQIC